MSANKVIEKTVKTIACTVVFVYAGLLMALNVPQIQTRLTRLASYELGRIFHTQVQVGSLDMGWLNQLVLQDVVIQDQQQQEMLRVSRLSAKLQVMPLFKGKISISSVQLYGFHINAYRSTPQDDPNYKFFLDAFASKDTVKQEFNLDLRINTVLIRKGSLAYHVHSLPHATTRFDVNHLAVSNLAATLSLKTLNSDSLNASVKRLEFDEASGISLNRISFKVTANRRQAMLRNLQVSVNGSMVQTDSICCTYPSPEDLFRLSPGTDIAGTLYGKLTPADAAPFVPALASLNNPIRFSLPFQADPSCIHIPLFQLSDQHGFMLRSEATATHWQHPDSLQFNAQIQQLTVSNETLAYYLTQLNQPIPTVCKELQQMDVKAQVNGTLRHINGEAQLLTNLGELQATAIYQVAADHHQTLQATLNGNAIKLGALLRQEDKWGDTGFQLTLNGSQAQGQEPEATLNGTVQSLTYNRYTYNDIALHGTYRQQKMDANLLLDDEHVFAQIEAQVDRQGAVPQIQLRTDIHRLHPDQLNLTKTDNETEWSGILTAHLRGNKLDQMEGTLQIDSAGYKSAQSPDYLLKQLNLTVQKEDNGEKNLTLTSDFMQATVYGHFSYATLPTSILKVVQQHLPSVMPLQSVRTSTDNDLRFHVQISRDDFFNRILNIPLQIEYPITLQGAINDVTDKIRIEGNFPGVQYNGKRFTSGHLLCANPNDQLQVNLRTGILLNSGAMVNVSLHADACDDQLLTEINWGNNTLATYSGKIKATAQFAKSADRQAPLKTRVTIHPTTVMLDDVVWNIHSSTVDVDSGKVHIDHFLFEHDDQYLRIHGDLSANADDSCRVDLNRINTEYVMHIIQFKDVAFGGSITGRVHARHVFRKPDLSTLLHVNNFTVNGALLGEADIAGTWDEEIGGIRVKADMTEENKSHTQVDGFISIRDKGLDLQIEADRTNVALLGVYLDDVFSELSGNVTGPVRLFGSFKYLDLEGDVHANIDAKIDALNTYFLLNNERVRIREGYLDFNGINIRDREGHTGLVQGYLKHNKLKDMTFRFDVQSRNLLLYDGVDDGNTTFYGRVYGSGNVTVAGGDNVLNVDARITTDRNSEFTYITGYTTEATSNQFITFVDKTPRRIQDTVDAEIYHPSEVQNKVVDDIPMDLHINLLVNATPDATIRIIMDPVSGDHITARGSGSLQANFFNKGDLKMFGTYIIDSGQYKLSLQEVIRKDFNLKQGGTVTFTGDPYLANLNLQAAYTVNSASLNDLGLDTSLSGGQNTIKVNCLMNMSGSLNSPVFKFDLELPNVREEERQLVRSITSTEEQMNTQIIYLLAIGKFYTYDINDQSSSATSSLAFSTLSGQLNNLLSQWMDNKNWNIGANLSTGEKGWTDVEAEAVLSGRLLNNRLLINGNFGYKEKVLSNTNFVGDFEAIWLLTKNGEWRLKGYNQTNDRYFTKTTLTTQGVGIMYKKDFDKWSDLFKQLLWFKTKKEKLDKKNEP